jgi:hypothetical protein
MSALCRTPAMQLRVHGGGVCVCGGGGGGGGGEGGGRVYKR